MRGSQRALAVMFALAVFGILGLAGGGFGRSAIAAGPVDLRITKTASVDEVIAGETVIYTVSIYNASNGTNDAATGVVVTDLLPVGATYLGDTNPGGTCSALSGSADPAVTTTNTTLTDTRLSMAVNAHVGKTIAAGGKTLVVTSNTATTFTGASWSGGGNPGNEVAWKMLDVTCAVGTIPAFQSVSFNIKVRVASNFVATTTTGTATLVNTVSVTSDAGDSNTADNTATSRILVGERADLRVTKFSQPVDETNSGCDTEAGPGLGCTVLYTIYVDNYGPSAARNVTIFDTLLSSDDVSIQSCAFSVSQGGGSITQFTCTTGNLVTTQFGTDIGTMRTNYLMPLSPAESSNGRLRASFRLLMNDSGTITNSTRVTSETYDPNTEDNFSSIDITVNPVVDLQAFAVFSAEVQTNGLPGKTFDSNVVTAMPDPACCNFGGTTATAGRRVQWDSSVTNSGPANAHNVEVEVSLPFGVSLIENTLTGVPIGGQAQGRCLTESAGQLRTKVICRFGTLYSPAEIANGGAPGGAPSTGSVRFVVLLDPSLPPGTQLAFDSNASADEPELNTSNNIAAVQFDTNAWADLSIVKNPLGPDPWLAGGTRTIRYDVASKGPSLARDVVVSDPLPGGLSFVAAYLGADAGDGGVPFPCFVDSTNRLECKLGDIAASDGTKKLFVQVKIAPDVPDGTVLSSTSTVSADTPDPLATDNSSSGADKTVSASADLKVEVKATVLEGGILGFFAFAKRTVSHEITVTNLGSSAAQDVELVINLPVSPYGKYAAAVISGCTQVGLVLTCDLGSMPAGTSKAFVVQFQMGALKGTVSLSAEVGATTPDPVLDNNEFETMVIFGSSGWTYHY